MKQINPESIFNITSEGERLRVKSEHINCLFSNLDAKHFSKVYKEYYEQLGLDFSPIEYGHKSYQLSEKEQEYLIQKLITSWIYFYSINGLEIKVKQSDFEHPSMVDAVLFVLDKKYGVDTKVSLVLGAKILRQKEEDYLLVVKGRRRYYDR